VSAKHALLGLLLERPAYPYQLADRLSQRLGPSWKVNSGQLYQTVKGLEENGLIERVHDTEREERHVFEITEQGVLEFERFFSSAPEGVRLSRRPLLVKLTFAGPDKLTEALDKLATYEKECAEQLAQAAHRRDELPHDGPLVRADHLLLRLNLSADVSQLEGELRWARHAREMLSWLASSDAIWPSERGNSKPADAAPEHTGAQARRELFSRIASSRPDADDPPSPKRGGRVK
jgi:DNA-binding PadR family transcriptional regulator